jgi:hypothetical protein
MRYLPATVRARRRIRCEIHGATPLRAAAVVTALALAASGGALADDGASEASCGRGVLSNEAEGFVWVPREHLFCQLVADPKAIRTFATLLRGTFPTSAGASNVGSVGIGDGLPFFRFTWPGAERALQLAVEAAIFSQFELTPNRADLLNVDYFVGFPLTFRLEGFSVRAREYHQSSHVGDQLLTRPGTTVRRHTLSFESFELMLAQDLAFARLYLGGEVLVGRTPSTLAPALAHFGGEVRRAVTEGIRLVAAVDAKASGQNGGRPAWSVRAGAELAAFWSTQQRQRVWSFLLEFYDGPSPYGEFFLLKARYGGFGFQFQI